MNWFTKTAFANGMSSMFLLILLACLILALPASLYGQNPLATTAAISGQAVTPFGGPAASAKVRVCLITATGIPCDTTGVTLFTDYMLTNSTANPISTDQFGNYKVFVTAGLYAVQVSLAGQSQPTYIYYDAASATASSAGALFPNTSAVVVNTSTLASRNAIFGDIVNLWGGVGCVGFLKNDGTCAAGGGGGGSPGGATTNAQFNNAGSFGGSRASFDAAGNFKSLTNDGIFNAFLAQTAPTSNNGIQNSLQTIGNFVNVGPDYASVEGIYGNGLCPNYRVAIGCPAPFANGTELNDYRLGIIGTYDYNTLFAPGGTTWKYHRWIQNQLPHGSGVSNFPFLFDTEMTGSGINGFEPGGPDSSGLYQWNFEYMTRGIVGAFNVEQEAMSLGDNHIWQNTISNQRGSTDASGEFFNTLRNQITQSLTPMVMLASSTLAAGATLIQGALISQVPFVGDGTYIIDFTKGSSIFKFTEEIEPRSTGLEDAGQLTVTSTLTPDNVGRVALPASLTVQRYGATTNVTVAVTGLTSALTTSQTVCYASESYQEGARVISAGSFSGGAQTVTVALRYNHSAHAYIVQGSHACNFIEIRANEQDAAGAFPGRQLLRVIGALDSHHYLVSRTVAGAWNNMLSGYATTESVAPAGATLTRNGSNVASVNVSDSFLHLSGDGIIITGCTDTSFNTTGATLISNNGSVVTWASTGSAGTTTCTSDIEILSRLNGFGAREAQEFTGAEITNTNDPTTFALCSSAGASCSVEPNTNFQITSGDRLENHVYSDVLQGFDHNLMNFASQNTENIASIMHQDQISQDIPEGTQWYRIAFTDPALHYQGMGGTKKISNSLFNMSDNITPFAVLFNLPTPVGGAFNFLGCPFGCADVRSKFTLFTAPTNGGVYSQTVHQDSGFVDTVDVNVGTSESTDIQLFPGAYALVVDGSSTVGVNLFSMHPGITEDDVIGLAGAASHMIQTPASWSVDVPITVPSCTGCGGAITGSVTTTGALTDVVTVTGMTSSGHCAAPGPTNAAAGTMIQNATPVFIDTFTTNSVTLHHVATGGASFSLVCTPN